MTKEEITRAKELDLLTYFKLIEPGNLKLVGKEYRHKVHSSLTISKDSLWCWHCIGLRGRTALKYLIDVEKVPYVEAVREIPKEEVQFIHDADTEAKKAELFGKVRSGAVRVLMGSTQKMGAGTNVQTRLCALHHLDCPWRPADIAQRNGRMVRQGNMNKEVSIFIYITEATFDAYSYQLVENKQKFISQIMTSKSPARSCEDSFYDYKKLRTVPYRTAQQIRSISDRLCMESQLSVIKDPQQLGQLYPTYIQKKRTASNRTEVRKKLNFCLERATNYAQFLQMAQDLGISVCQRGKHMTYLLDGAGRAIRDTSLADTDKFTYTGIMECLEDNAAEQQFIRERMAKIFPSVSTFTDFIKQLQSESVKARIKKQTGQLLYKAADLDGT